MLTLDSRYLAQIRLEAMRRRVWFRVLSSLERGLVDFVIRVIDKPRSQRLIEVLAKIVVKIKRAIMSPIKHLMEIVGRPLAKKISIIALRWGNRSALKWVEDEGFIRYLTIVNMNNIPGFRLSESLQQAKI